LQPWSEPGPNDPRLFHPDTESALKVDPGALRRRRRRAPSASSFTNRATSRHKFFSGSPAPPHFSPKADPTVIRRACGSGLGGLRRQAGPLFHCQWPAKFLVGSRSLTIGRLNAECWPMFRQTAANHSPRRQAPAAAGLGKSHPPPTMSRWAAKGKASRGLSRVPQRSSAGPRGCLPRNVPLPWGPT